jgi:hypothetical protein
MLIKIPNFEGGKARIERFNDLSEESQASTDCWEIRRQRRTTE